MTRQASAQLFVPDLGKVALVIFKDLCLFLNDFLRLKRVHLFRLIYEGSNPNVLFVYHVAEKIDKEE